jgi:hypothetical protein
VNKIKIVAERIDRIFPCRFTCEAVDDVILQQEDTVDLAE